MCVYRILNNINHKCYVGITSRSFSRRYPGGWWKTKNSHLRAAVAKYGVEHFSIEILESNLESYEVLLQREVHYIELFSAISHGYNKTTGGVQPIFSQASRDKRRDSINRTIAGGYRPKSTFLGRQHSEETRRQISESKQGKKGWTPSEEQKKIKSEQMSGKYGQLLHCVETGRVFSSIKELASEFQYHPDYLCRLLKKTNKIKGYTFELVR